MLNKLFTHRYDGKHAAILIVIFSACALLASFVLSYEKLHLLTNPDAQLSCSINLVFNCATVMKSEEASVLGDIPNSFLGMMGFTASLTLGVVMLSGSQLARWIKASMWVGFLGGWLFALWLFFSSLYDIGVLCPWCLVVTFSTTILFATMTHIVLRDSTIGLSKTWRTRVQKWLDSDLDTLATAAFISLLVALVIIRFGNGLFA